MKVSTARMLRLILAFVVLSVAFAIRGMKGGAAQRADSQLSSSTKASASAGVATLKTHFHMKIVDPAYTSPCDVPITPSAASSKVVTSITNANNKVLFVYRLLYLCGQPYTEQMANKDFFDKTTSLIIDGCVTKVLADLGYPPNTDPVPILTTKLDKAKLTAAADKEEARFMSCLQTQGKDLADGSAAVKFASYLVGRVNAMDRGDGAKAGWLFLQTMYKDVFQDRYDPKWDKALKTPGWSSPKIAAWSWCGIFTSDMAQHVKGKGNIRWGIGKVAWETAPKSPLKNYAPVFGKTMTGVSEGDMIHWVSAENHMSLFHKKSTADNVDSIDGNGIMQGISYNVRSVSVVAGITKLMGPPPA